MVAVVAVVVVVTVAVGVVVVVTVAVVVAVVVTVAVAGHVVAVVVAVRFRCSLLAPCLAASKRFEEANKRSNESYPVLPHHKLIAFGVAKELLLAVLAAGISRCEAAR